MNGPVTKRFTGLEERFSATEHHITAAMSDLRATIEREMRAQSATIMFGFVSVVLIMATMTLAVVRFA